MWETGSSCGVWSEIRRNGRPLFSDLLGELLEFGDEHLVLRTSDGSRHTVPLAEVTHAKRVPPRRAANRRIIEVELAADEAWPAPVRDRLGDWVLRAADGWTGRGNSALPVGDPGLPLEEAIDAVVTWYRDHRLTPMINVPLPYASTLDAALAARGWDHRPLTLMQVAPLTAVLAGTELQPDLPPVRLSAAPSEAWLEVAAGRKGGLPAAAPAPAHRRGPGPVRRGVRRQRRTARDRARLGQRSRLVRVHLVEVVPAARRRGLARHIVGALARWATSVGASRAYLQVEQHNTPAVTLYARIGFTPHHHYLTRHVPARPVDQGHPRRSRTYSC